MALLEEHAGSGARLLVSLVVALTGLFATATRLSAQDSTARAPDVVCVSQPGERQSCAADTKGGVTLLRDTGSVACDLGTSWGYDQESIWVFDGCSAAFALGKARKSFGIYTPNRGFKVADTDHGDLSIKIYTYVRYLNQRGLDSTYTNAFGNTVPVQRRQDIQLNKVNIQFLGWLMSEKFRYLLYVWTTNVSLGLGAQVIVAGNLTYAFDPHIKLGIGVNALPGVRSTGGNFPFWLTVDNRLIADEFFRPSFTTGVWAEGAITDRLSYSAMLGNNLSQIGVDAGQLDNGLNTISTAVTWLPTTGEFGPIGDFGDLEHHEKAATRLAGHFTISRENYQGQPDNNNFENVQIRLSNGGIIFAPDLFGPGIWVQDARYQMADVDAAVKYRGFSLAGEYYWRWVNNFKGPNTEGLPSLFDHGFQVQASGMIVPRTLQAYLGGSKVFGQYGNPSDIRVGLNWYPWHNHVVRLNAEFMQLYRSPVGALSLPYSVGANGPVFYTSLEVNF